MLLMGTDMPIVKVFHGSRFRFVSFRNLLSQVTVKIEYYADNVWFFIFSIMAWNRINSEL